MKKLIVTTAILLFTVLSVNAQSPIIKDLREIIAQRTSGFKSLQKDLLQDNTEKNVKIYDAALGQSSICKAFITQSAVNGATYLMVFTLADMDGMKLKIFDNMTQQYITELNDMVKTGNYKGRDYMDGDSLVTEITDLNGKVVTQYISNATDHMIVVLGN